MYPKAGGIYEFAKEAFGRFVSFLVGWTGWLIGNITTAMLIAGGVQYLIPTDSPGLKTFKILICIGLLLIFNYVAYRGVETSAAMLTTFPFITIGLVLIPLIIISAIGFKFENLTPFFIHDGVFSNIGIIYLTVFFISETFFGVESVLSLAEETKDPQKTIPRALLWGIGTVCIVALLLVFTSLGSFHWTEFSKLSAPYADVAASVLGELGRKVITVLTYMVMVGAAAGWIVTTPRLLLALARDKVFPPQFEALHYKYNSPYKGVIFQTITQIVLIFIAFSTSSGYETLLHLLIPMTSTIHCARWDVWIHLCRSVFCIAHYRLACGRPSCAQHLFARHVFCIYEHTHLFSYRDVL
jgi:APA family basic amino acid/polyamine antiporter